ncbi:small ribosomal subunit Rsm22 family protein [Desulfovibrio sp. ZJ200]|uniref:small ribosomal subunit Rsm22 family protein n=1 Tax=Desulfovibrio sp. ZJ200 TaxID=2709792 RepID=UPI0013EA6268|nr:small ribosomal subunit Rsm22 family protein [Desulfovibrio sp. ZJ200]
MTRRASSPCKRSRASKKSGPAGGQRKARKPGSASTPRLGAGDARSPRLRPHPGPTQAAGAPAATPTLVAPSGQARPALAPGAWAQVLPLFPPLSAAAREALERLPEALARVRPLSAAHRRSLPEDVATLSRLLTCERGALRRPYWSSPAFVSAYLYYFLPWNLLRLTRLLRGLPLPAPQAPAFAGGQALLLDAGSGPLSLPLALWLARPQWREAPVRVLALDSAAQPLELGRALFTAWGRILGQKTWPVHTARGPLGSLARHAAPLLSGGRGAGRDAQRGPRLQGEAGAVIRPWLISAANVLNELPSGRRFGGSEEGEESPGSPRDEPLERLLDAWAPLLLRGNGDLPAPPALLFVEPGTRLGGTTIMRLRALALERGLKALAPCPHQAACPLLAGSGGRTWCHFTFDGMGAPDWLRRLSAQAGLAKSGLSLAPLLLAPDVGAEPASEASAQALPAALRVSGRGAQPARVLSAPFAVPGLAGQARYACAAAGLLLLEDAATLASGDLLPIRLESNAPRDAKSRARVIRRPPPGRD